MQHRAELHIRWISPSGVLAFFVACGDSASDNGQVIARRPSGGVASKEVLHYFRRIAYKSLAMTTLNVTAPGQVTFRKDLLQHLGIKPGEKIEVDLLPDGRAALKAARPAGTIADFLGLLAGKTAKVATIEEMNAAAAKGWAGEE